MLTRDITSRAILAERDPEPELHRCTCPVPDRMAETPDDAARCAYCGGLIVRPIVRPAPGTACRPGHHRPDCYA